MDSKQPSKRSLASVIAAAIIAPPLGIILIWLRRDLGRTAKVLGTVLLTLLSGVYLILFLGLQIEMDGTGRKPIFSIYDEDRHYDALEADRARQKGGVEAESAATGDGVVEENEIAGTRLVSNEQTPSTSAVNASNQPPGAADDNYWTDFRGPGRDGHYREMPIMTRWPSPGLSMLWKQPIGGGYASFVIAGGRAFTIEQRREQEVATAYDLKTGRELWAYGWDAFFEESMGGDGPRATPTWDRGRLYALGAAGHLVCLNASNGQPLWSLNILEDNDAGNLTWGMSAAPLIVDDKVIVLPGGSSGRSVVAYDKVTGEKAWSSQDDKQAYTSPMLVTLAGTKQLLVVSASRVMGLTVDQGELLWDYPWVTDYGINSAQPLIVDDHHFFISAGYGHGAALVEVRQQGESFSAQNVWQNINMKNKFNSSVLYQGHVYGLDEGILAAVDVRTGERKWKGGRYGYGQLLLAEGHLIILTEEGELVLVEATPEGHREQARFPAISGKTWNHPAISDGLLLVRNTTEMACFSLLPGDAFQARP